MSKTVGPFVPRWSGEIGSTPHRHPRRRSVVMTGFSLIEVLVALALFGIVFAGLLALTRSTLQFSGLSVGVAGSVSDVAKAEGYVSDLFRVAKGVYGTLDVVGPDGDTLACRLQGSVIDGIEAGRCIGMLIPVVEDDDGVQAILDYDLAVLSVEAIGQRFADVGVPRGFDGDNTLALFEYRATNLCASATPAIAPCTAANLGIDDGTVINADSFGLILGGVSDVNESSAVVSTFTLAGDASASRTLLIRFVVRADSSAGSPFTVRQSAVALEVAVRGVASAEGE